MTIPANWADFASNPNGWFLENGAIRSNNIGDSGSTELILDIVEDSIFGIRTESEVNCDFLLIYDKNSVEVKRVSGNPAVATVSLLASLSPYRFRYQKDGSVSSGGDSAYITDIPEDAFYIFEGDFLPLGTVPLDMVYPLSAITSTTIGTGLLNSSGAPVYIRSSLNISIGETKHIINADLSVNSTLSFTNDGTLTLTEGDVVTIVSSELQVIGLAILNGQLAVADENGVPALSSFLFEYAGSFATVELADNSVVDSIPIVDFKAGDVVALRFPFLSLTTPQWANKETRAQANPYPANVQFLADENDIKLMGKSGNYLSLLDQRGEQRRTGYYQSTVTISGIPTANRRVLCFTNDGQLRDETRSDAQGVYRFDHLQMNEKYMFVAQYDNATETPPEYLATASDWQSSTAY